MQSKAAPLLVDVQVPAVAAGAFEISVIDPVKQGDTVGVRLSCLQSWTAGRFCMSAAQI